VPRALWRRLDGVVRAGRRSSQGGDTRVEALARRIGTVTHSFVISAARREDHFANFEQRSVSGMVSVKSSETGRTRDGTSIRCWTFPRARERRRDHPHRQGRPGRVKPGPDGLGRRPRLRLRGQPGLPDPQAASTTSTPRTTAHQYRSHRGAGPTRAVRPSPATCESRRYTWLLTTGRDLGRKRRSADVAPAGLPLQISR
jgi:hypothetical protein